MNAQDVDMDNSEDQHQRLVTPNRKRPRASDHETSPHGGQTEDDHADKRLCDDTRIGVPTGRRPHGILTPPPTRSRRTSVPEPQMNGNPGSPAVRREQRGVTPPPTDRKASNCPPGEFSLRKSILPTLVNLPSQTSRSYLYGYLATARTSPDTFGRSGGYFDDTGTSAAQVACIVPHIAG